MSTSLLTARLLRGFGALMAAALFAVSFQTAQAALPKPDANIALIQAQLDLVTGTNGTTIADADTAQLRAAVENTIASKKATYAVASTYLSSVLAVRADNEAIAGDLVVAVIGKVKSLSPTSTLKATDIAPVAAAALAPKSLISGADVANAIVTKVYAAYGNTITSADKTNFINTLIKATSDASLISGAVQGVILSGSGFPVNTITKVPMTAVEFAASIAKTNVGTGKAGGVIGGLALTSSDPITDAKSVILTLAPAAKDAKNSLPNLVAGSLPSFTGTAGTEYITTLATSYLSASPLIAQVNLAALAKGAAQGVAQNLGGNPDTATQYVGTVLEMALTARGPFGTNAKAQSDFFAAFGTAATGGVGVNTNPALIGAITANIASNIEASGTVTAVASQALFASSVIAKVAKANQGQAAADISKGLLALPNQTDAVNLALTLAKASSAMAAFEGNIAAGIAGEDAVQAGAVTMAIIKDSTLGGAKFAKAADIAGKVAAAVAYSYATDVATAIYNATYDSANILLKDKAAACATAMVTSLSKVYSVALSSTTTDPVAVAKEIADSAITLMAAIKVDANLANYKKAVLGVVTALTKIKVGSGSAAQLAAYKLEFLQRVGVEIATVIKGYGMDEQFYADVKTALGAGVPAGASRDGLLAALEAAYNSQTPSRGEVVLKETPFANW